MRDACGSIFLGGIRWIVSQGIACSTGAMNARIANATGNRVSKSSCMAGNAGLSRIGVRANIGT